MAKALTDAGAMPTEEVNAAVFAALGVAVGAAVEVNEHDFPAFGIDAAEADGAPVRLEFVQAPHYLLCAHPQGYLRFC